MGKSNRGAIGGLVFAVGLIGGLIGFMTDVYSSSVGVLAMLAIWFVGGAIAAIMFRGE